jgi:hypothetical protein
VFSKLVKKFDRRQSREGAVAVEALTFNCVTILRRDEGHLLYDAVIGYG